MKVLFKKALCAILALMVVACMFSACRKNDDGADTNVGGTSGSPTEENKDTSSDGPRNEKLDASFASANFTFFDECPGVMYTAYNGYNNPISEKFIACDDVDGIYCSTYEYNVDGRLTAFTLSFYNYDGYAEKVDIFRAEYDVQTGIGEVLVEAVKNSQYSSTVEYHDNGVIKNVTIMQGTKLVISKEFDSLGRCVQYADLYTSTGSVYDADSYTASSCTYTEGEFSTTVSLTYTDGMISSASFNGGEETYKYDLEHTSDKKNLQKSMVYEYEGTDLSDQYSIEFTYTASGLFTSIIFTDYQDGVKGSSQKMEYLYNENGLMTKETRDNYDQTGKKQSGSVCDVEYDENKNIVKVTDKRYDGNDALINGIVTAMEYDSSNHVTKRQRYALAADGITQTLGSETIYEYDQNGNVSKEVNLSYNDSGEIVYHHEYIYDYEYDENNIITKLTAASINYDSTGKINYQSRWENEYVNGVITKRTTYEYNNPNDPNEITATRITTYNADGTSSSTVVTG